MRYYRNKSVPFSTALAVLLCFARTTASDKHYCSLNTLAVPERSLVCGMPVPRLKFALHGDSLTQQSFDVGGWGARFASLYQRKADITLRGYSGYNTRWALQTLEQNFPLNGPTYDFATVWFGANDAALADRHNARQHVPAPEYKRNLGAIVDRLLALGAKVIVITPPPVDEAARISLAIEILDKLIASLQNGHPLGSTQPERTLEAARKYAQAAVEVAKSRAVPCLDLWSKLQSVPNWQSLLSDGLHFNAAGNQAVYNALIDLFDTEFLAFR